MTNLLYALRQLRKSPALALSVIGTLALCIGANTAIYSVVDALFFRALPYPHPEQLVMLTTVQAKGAASATDTSQNGAQWEAIRDGATFLDSAVYGSPNGVNLAAGSQVEYVQNQRVSANFFHVLGIAPLLGREFSRQEDLPNGPPVAMLSYPLWQRVFHGDPTIVGRTIDLRGAPYVVTGILPLGFRPLPSGFGSDDAPDVWTPLRPTPTGEGGGDNYGVIGRMKPGVTLAQASEQANAVMRDVFARLHAPAGLAMYEKAISLRSGLTYDVRNSMHLMWGAVALVLLIGCVNIAGILMARSGARSREVATRLALGAGRGRIVFELLTEAMVLALLGGVCGLAVGQFALKGLLALNPALESLAGPVALSVPVLALMMALALGTSLVFGLYPAWEASGVDLRSALSEGGRGNSGGRNWTRQALVFVEVALGVVLVIAAGLLIRTFLTIANANSGFDPQNLMIASASLQDARYATTAEGARLFRQSLDRIRQIPGVESAAVALSSPYSRPLNEGVSFAGGHEGITEFTYVTPAMFETLRMRLLRGRLFADSDNAGAARVAVVNQTFAARYAQALGTPVKIEGKSWQIVGVVNDVQEKNGIGGGAPVDRFPEVYVPVEQFPDGIFGMANVWFSPVWMVRTSVSAPVMARQMRQAMASVDAKLPFSSFVTMADVRGAAMRNQRYEAAIFSVLAGLATMLAALGLYGLIAQGVAQRTREMGIRLALGATVAGVIRAAALPGIFLSVAGIGFGVLLALFATRLLRSEIWGVEVTDPETFLVVAATLLSVAALASLLPALKLARIDPARSLRAE